MSNYYTKSEADMLLQAKAGVNADNFTAAGKDTIIDNSF